MRDRVRDTVRVSCLQGDTGRVRARDRLRETVRVSCLEVNRPQAHALGKLLGGGRGRGRG